MSPKIGPAGVRRTDGTVPAPQASTGPQVPEGTQPRQDWQSDAACRGKDPEIFFPLPPGTFRRAATDKAYAEAKTICARCPVIADCERDHINETDGVWFGTTPPERKRLRAERGLIAFKHGTTYGYRTFKCHCLSCTAAKREAEKRWRDKKRGGAA